MANPLEALDESEFAAWFRLVELLGLSRSQVRSLLATFGSPEAVLAADPAERARWLPPRTRSQAIVPEPEAAARLDAAHRWRAGPGERHVLVLGDPRYPSALLQTADPPVLLYVMGSPHHLQADSLAVVGSRHPTPQGLNTAREFSQAIAAAGPSIVSGLARGIDAAAHEGALAAGGVTVAVVGTGLDRVYPAVHRDLARRIAESGALLSEFPPGTPVLAANFPQRNRIIAGLSRGVLVVEAALRSGSLITARQAAEMGREVLAVPGSIHSPTSRGCHALIKQGAQLVETADDVLEALGSSRPCAPDDATATDQPAQDPLLAAMGFEPVHLDALGARTGWAAATLAARLLDLELGGEVARLPGGLYQRTPRA